MPEHPRFRPMLGKGMIQWQLQMAERHILLWLRVVRQLITATKIGPTAVFKSVSKLPTHEITGGVLLNQKVTPQLLEKEENKMKLEMLIKTFF